MTIHNLLAASAIPRLDAEVLLAHVLKKNRSWILAHPDDPVSAAKTRQFHALVTRRKKHEPVAYLMREKEFFGRTFTVNHHVLVPRPETELMVERALRSTREARGAKQCFWDVGTGSGAIAVTLACERPDAAILATDVSARALAVAKKNAARHHAANQITFLKSNLLQPAVYRLLARHASDRTTAHPHDRDLLITANLPYLPASDKKILAPDVTTYEPSLALFSGADGLTLIRQFLGQLARHLPEWNYQRVTILLEFDPPQAKTLTALAKKRFPRADIMIHRDLAGRNRIMEIVA